jgi:copper chaperone CopZ
MHPLQQSDNEAAKCAICKMKLTNKDKYNETVDKKVDEMKAKIKDKDNMSYEEFKVARYRSDECEKFITSAVNKIGSVTDVYIDKLEPSVHVVYDKSKTDKDKIEDAIAAAGFDPKDDDKNTAVKLPDDCYDKPPAGDTKDTTKKR